MHVSTHMSTRRWLLMVLMLVTIVLLMQNLLIAMFAKTFDNIFEVLLFSAADNIFYRNSGVSN